MPVRVGQLISQLFVGEVDLLNLASLGEQLDGTINCGDANSVVMGDGQFVNFVYGQGAAGCAYDLKDDFSLTGIALAERGLQAGLRFW